MIQTLSYLENEFSKLDKIYWKLQDSLEKKQAMLKTLTAEVNYLQKEIAEIDVERQRFLTMINELNGNSI